ncbi:TauD/TfdA family dioxygenase [Natronoglycomyces albus]|uniref:TauD/TfdA family dioxygenase n=1 Tax=Natronoglycomyces albus TaxID=2811108 RepID=A0A895XWT8_9ACTN|nr:TauD/TfdA family dioxygenase [Natronoglycomyces albus]
MAAPPHRAVGRARTIAALRTRMLGHISQRQYNLPLRRPDRCPRSDEVATELAQVRIAYSTNWRPTSTIHPLIVEDPAHGLTLRFRSGFATNTVCGPLPPSLSEAAMYAEVEAVLSEAVAVVYRWRPGDLLVVDNRAMIHVRGHAPNGPLPLRRPALQVRHNRPIRHSCLPAPILCAIAPGIRPWWKIRKPATFGVKALLLHPEGSGRFLVVRHSSSDPSRWGLPDGGYRPAGETPE